MLVLLQFNRMLMIAVVCWRYSPNPGPAPKCQSCVKTIQSKQEVNCSDCFNNFHLKYAGSKILLT